MPSTKTYLLGYTLRDSKPKDRSKVNKILCDEPINGEPIDDMETLWKVESKSFKNRWYLLEAFKVELCLVGLSSGTNIDIFVVNVSGRPFAEEWLEF